MKNLRRWKKGPAMLLKPLTMVYKLVPVDTRQITAGAASCNDDNLMRHINEDQQTAISVMRTNFHTYIR